MTDARNTTAARMRGERGSRLDGGFVGLVDA
jgi:hypothetical protein